MRDSSGLPSPQVSLAGREGGESFAAGRQLSGAQTGVTVSEVLRVVLPPGAAVVAGAEALGRRVTWATQLRSRPPAFETSGGGEFVLASAATLASLRVFDDSLTLEHLVEGLAEAGAAGLALAGEVGPAEQKAAADAADRLGLPLIRVPAAPLTDLERTVIGLVFDRRAQLQQHATRVFRRLAQLSMEGRGLQAILSATAQITGRTVAFEDAGFRLLAVALPQSAPAAGGAPAAATTGGSHEDDAADTLSSIAERSQLNRWVRGQALEATTPPVLALPATRWRCWRLAAPVVTRDRVRGFLSLCGPEAELTDLEQLLVSRAAAVCALELAKEDAVLAAEHRVQRELADELLAGRWADPEGIIRRAQLVGLAPDSRFAVLALALDREPASPGEPRALLTATEARERVRDVLARELHRLLPGALLKADEESLAIVCPVAIAALAADGGGAGTATTGHEGRLADPESGWLQARAQALQSVVHRGVEGYLLSIGVSSVHAGLTGVAAAGREARDALRIGCQVFGPGRCTPFAELGVYRLLFPLRESPELRRFADQVLGALEEYDRRTSAGLLETLEAYFACHGNLSRTAQRLILHRNTLLYRINRAQEIGQFDLRDAEVRLTLQVALKVRRLLAGS